MNFGVKDRISKLPDSVIHHILSFLPIKSAASTTVLSTRWKNLWVHVPTLDFSYGSSKDEPKKLMDFVDRVLVLRNMSTLHKFRLTYEYHYHSDYHYLDNNRVKEWISTAIQCNVKELIVSLRSEEGEYTLPVNHFSSESLTKLDINYPVATECILDHPQSISFPKLKILHLGGILFRNETLVQQLFSSFPLLEELCLTNCVWKKINLISISAPTLKSFTLDGGHHSNMMSIKLKIDAPNLTSIKYRDWLPMDFVVSDFPSLVHVELILFNKFRSSSDFHALSKFLMKLSHLQSLQLVNSKIISLVNALPTSVPTFKNLIHLETEFIQADTLLKFLQFTPNLESLIIGWKSGKVNEDASTVNLVPDCLLLHLKTIEVREVEGLPKELKFVEYILKNARILHMLIVKSEIASRTVAQLKKKTQVMDQLLMYPRTSTNCMVKFLSS